MRWLLAYWRVPAFFLVVPAAWAYVWALSPAVAAAPVLVVERPEG